MWTFFERQRQWIWTPKQDGPAISELERTTIKGDKRVKDLIYTYQSRLGRNCSPNETPIRMNPFLSRSVSNSTTHPCTVPRQIIKPCTGMVWRKYWSTDSSIFSFLVYFFHFLGFSVNCCIFSPITFLILLYHFRIFY